MQISISGIHVDTGDAFRTHVEEALGSLNDRYQLVPVEASVVLTKDGYEFRSDISTHLGRGIIMRGQGIAKDAHLSFDAAIDALAKRLVRHKKRLRDHHKHRDALHKYSTAPYYIVDLKKEKESSNDKAPPIIAELKTEIPTLTVSDAVMRLDLSQQRAMLFHNEAHGGLNMIYLRPDGNIGWVDPQDMKK